MIESVRDVCLREGADDAPEGAGQVELGSAHDSPLTRPGASPPEYNRSHLVRARQIAAKRRRESTQLKSQREVFFRSTPSARAG